MKRFLIFALLTVAFIVAAPASDKKGPQMKFKSEKVDLGNIDADGKPVTFSYPFTNTGDAPLVIVNVTNGGCGCTTPKFTKAPIAPGATDSITITFNPRGRRGELKRSVTVRSNAANRSSRKLTFTGVVIPSKKK